MPRFLAPWTFSALLLWSAHAVADSPRLFHAASLPDVVATYAGQPFALLLWSKECSSCLRELKDAGVWRRKYPQLRIALIATDGPADAARLTELLAARDLGDVPSWVFAEGDSPVLRYAVDSAWVGELPRSYLYAADGQRRARTGILTEAELAQWIQTEN